MSKSGLPRSAAKILDAAEVIAQRPEPEPSERAFIARQLVQVTLPHSDPGNVPAWSRTNGDLTLSIQPGFDHEEKKPLGLPYGTIPRLVLFWITTEVLRTGERRLVLGHSLADFMREVGLDPSRGGPRSDAARLREQLRRLTRARISFDVTRKRGEQEGSAWLDMQVAPKGMMWWDHKVPERASLWESWIELSPEFFEALRAAPVPVDVRALRALKSSALSLDIYSWAAWRVFVVNRKGEPAFIPWRALQRQLGGDYGQLGDFRRKVQQALRKVSAVYPGLRFDVGNGGVTLYPSKTPVALKAE